MPESAIDRMLDKVRKALYECAREGVSEKDCYEALTSESEGWKMRLQELEQGGDEDV